MLFRSNVGFSPTVDGGDQHSSANGGFVTHHRPPLFPQGYGVPTTCMDLNNGEESEVGCSPMTDSEDELSSVVDGLVNNQAPSLSPSGDGVPTTFADLDDAVEESDMGFSHTTDDEYEPSFVTDEFDDRHTPPLPLPSDEAPATFMDLNNALEESVVGFSPATEGEDELSSTIDGPVDNRAPSLSPSGDGFPATFMDLDNLGDCYTPPLPGDEEAPATFMDLNNALEGSVVGFSPATEGEDELSSTIDGPVDNRAPSLSPSGDGFPATFMDLDNMGNCYTPPPPLPGDEAPVTFMFLDKAIEESDVGFSPAPDGEGELNSMVDDSTVHHKPSLSPSSDGIPVKFVEDEAEEADADAVSVSTVVSEGSGSDTSGLPNHHATSLPPLGDIIPDEVVMTAKLPYSLPTIDARRISSVADAPTVGHHASLSPAKVADLDGTAIEDDPVPIPVTKDNGGESEGNSGDVTPTKFMDFVSGVDKVNDPPTSAQAPRDVIYAETVRVFDHCAHSLPQTFAQWTNHVVADTRLPLAERFASTPFNGSVEAWRNALYLVRRSEGLGRPEDAVARNSFRTSSANKSSQPTERITSTHETHDGPKVGNVWTPTRPASSHVYHTQNTDYRPNGRLAQSYLVRRIAEPDLPGATIPHSSYRTATVA